ncbi:MAG: hypothetical protein NTY77_07230 [Elusimicrobia bacterium]|nr:hypothetical protein [Elusimicrobiota bacterium]
MHRPHSAVLLILLAFGAACKRKEAAPIPVLSPPERASRGSGEPGVRESLPSEAEVTASSGPVQLTLRIYKKQIRAHHPLYYQIELKNIGTRPFPAVDDAFIDPWAQEHRRVGVYLDVIGPDGKAPNRAELPPPFSLNVDPFKVGALPPPETKAGAAFRKKLEGMSALERSLAVGDYLRQGTAEYEKTRPRKGILLEPGASTTTVAWVLQDELQIMAGKPPRQPVGQYTEFVVLDFSPPGKYRIRTVYDYLPGGWLTKFNGEHHLQPHPDQVKVATPFIEFEVLP